MEILNNERVVKIENAGFFATLKDILIGNKVSKDEEELNKEINNIFKVEAENGGTDRIANLVKRLQTHSTENSKRKSSTKTQTEKFKTKIEETEIEVEIQSFQDEERDI